MNIAAPDLPRLKQLWGAGLSAIECGTEIGLTGEASAIREAVLRAIENMNKPQPKPPKPTTQRKQRHQERVQDDDDSMFATDGVDGTPKVEDLDIPVEQRKSFFELTAKTCKWPVGQPGQPDFFFCGGVSVEGRPYCPHHCRRAYAGTTRRTA